MPIMQKKQMQVFPKTVLMTGLTNLQLAVPSYPVVFTKPADALAGPYDDIPIHPDAQSQLDYEGELCVVIGKDAKNVPEADALDYVLGYTAGNDVSARNFQIPAAVSGNQFSYAKSFDQFAPIGPTVLLGQGVDPQALKYTTKVNGQVRQQTGTDDMIWNVKQIIAHLSRGTTLRKGTVIMTGTPSGVGLFVEPKGTGFLKDGDVVEIEIEGVGAIANKVVFER
jgi:2-keto-4-pentenoate hydratase/2-oxohepta-3-ene-1,7-dioic acid hydratase in catechol pathway